MNKKLVGALVLLVLGTVAILGVWFFLPYFREMQQMATSDAGRTKGKIVLALDNWIGYFVFRSRELKKLMHQAGWTFVVEDDSADYAQRMRRLKRGEINFAVATVDSYILNAAELDFPGSIIMVVDESKGGDAILARKEGLASLDALKGKENLRIAFTPNSPSHHLAKAAAHHFSVPELMPPPGENRIETKGSNEALQKLLAGSTDVAVLWEPDVSRALSHPGVTKILGTEDTQKLIVDVLIVGRRFAQKNADVVKLLLSNYFRALKTYQDKLDLLHKEIEAETGLSERAVESMLKGVKWVNLTQNCEQWFGIAPPGGRGEDGLIRAIESGVNVLINAGDFSGNPLPDGDPYRLVYSTYLEELFVKGVAGFTTPAPGSQSAAFGTQPQSKFSPLSEEQWNKLKEVGTLKVEPIVFQHGDVSLDLLGKEVVDKAAALFEHYPNFRLVVKGHTGTRGDPKANQRLSQERAESVARYMTVTHRMDPNRIRAVGFGGSKPLARKEGESLRAWQYRLPRVELVLVREEY